MSCQERMLETSKRPASLEHVHARLPALAGPANWAMQTSRSGGSGSK